MQNTNVLPLEFVRDIYAALAGTAADFDADDFATLPALCQIRAFFGTSHGPNDIQSAVNSAFPYPAGTRVDALVVVRGKGIDMGRFQAIQNALRTKMHYTSSLFLSVAGGKGSTLPPGTASIILLAISHNKTKKTLQPFLKLVVQDGAQKQPE